MYSGSQFSKIRSIIFPVQRHELAKLVPMWLMMFFICFNYNVLRCLKEPIIVTACGAEVLPFIKVWVMLPLAILMTCVFTRLSNKFSQEKVFYLIISGFLIAFLGFAFILYPLSNQLHPHAFCDTLEGWLPSGFRGLVSMIRYWTYTGFYAMSELWGILVMSVLFWGLANEVTKVKEARRFYGFLGVAANIAAIIAGQAGNYISQGNTFNPSIPFGSTGWEQTVMLLVLTIVTTGLMIMGLFRWLNNNVLNDPTYADLHRTKKPYEVKQKLSVKDSFKYLSKSKYLICIAILVVSYNLVINIVEIVWKDQLGKLYTSPSEFNNYMNNLTTIVGIISTIAALFMSRLIKNYGWTGTALITPIIMLVTSIGFFAFVIFQGYLGPIVFALTGTTPVVVAVFFGASQNCMSRAAKYSVFDATKEMSFIPLDHECKLKGKAAIDGVGSRLGKSGGSIIHTMLLLVFTSLTASSHIVAVIITIVIAAWIYAVCSLGRQFNALTEKREKEEIEEREQAAPVPAVEEEWQEAGSQLKQAS